MKFLPQILLSTTLLLLMSCADNSTYSNAAYSNPYPSGTLEYFQAEKNYKYTYDVWTNKPAYEKLQPWESSLVISLTDQRALLMKGSQVIIDYPICSGKEEYPTPPGRYRILEKTEDKVSTLYGKVLNEADEVINDDADIREVELKPGERFEGVAIPYWMRLTWDGVGHHVGIVHRDPASHSCVRGTKEMMPKIFAKVQVGTPVLIVE